jgi:uncharacterized protein with HEPN domain
MPKDDWVYLGHMLDMSRKAAALTEGIDRSNYDQDEALRLALTHLIQTIGEAAQRVSMDLKQAYPQIPWREMVGMRNRIVHDYLSIDEDVIWEVVQQDLPPLVSLLEEIIPADMR